MSARRERAAVRARAHVAACLFLILTGGLALPAQVNGEADLSFFPPGLLLSDAAPMDGRPVYLNFTVTAEGIGVVQKVMAEFLVDGHLEAFTDLELAPNRSSFPVSFRWMAYRGHHNLSVVLDPLGELNESVELNNLAWVEVQVRAVPAPSPDNGGYYVLAAAVVLLAVIGIGAALVRKRGGPRTGGEREGEESETGTPPTAR